MSTFIVGKGGLRFISFSIFPIETMLNSIWYSFIGNALNTIILFVFSIHIIKLAYLLECFCILNLVERIASWVTPIIWRISLSFLPISYNNKKNVL